MPIANKTRVTWKSGTTRGGRETTVCNGTIEGYIYHDMPWKLYQIMEQETGRTAFVHPDHIVRTYGQPHMVGKVQA